MLELLVSRLMGSSKRIDLYNQEKKSTNAIEQHRQLNSLKAAEFPSMYELSKCAPQEALRDLDKAFRHFYPGIQKGSKVGFPRFKKKGIRDSFRLTGAIKVNKASVQLPRLGMIRLKEKSAVEGHILSATIFRQGGSLVCQCHCRTANGSSAPVEGAPIRMIWALPHNNGLKDLRFPT